MVLVDEFFLIYTLNLKIYFKNLSIHSDKKEAHTIWASNKGELHLEITGNLRDYLLLGAPDASPVIYMARNVELFCQAGTHPEVSQLVHKQE